MIVLVEVADANDLAKPQEFWDLLASVYATKTQLLDFVDDRRRLHAAEHVVAAWKVQAGKFAGEELEKPPMISEVERKFVRQRWVGPLRSSRDRSSALAPHMSFLPIAS
jgi:hypothetical protein